MHCVQAPMHSYCHVMAELLDTLSLRERRNGTRLENPSPRTDVFQGSYEKHVLSGAMGILNCYMPSYYLRKLFALPPRIC